MMLALVACEQPGGSGAQGGSASIRPPEWIQGHWKCATDGQYCGSYLPPHPIFFTETEVRQGYADSSLVLFSDAVVKANARVYKITQTVTSSTYTIEQKADTQSYVYRWTRTDSGLDSEYEASGALHLRETMRLERWSGSL